jgi:hypothetical protein
VPLFAVRVLLFAALAVPLLLRLVRLPRLGVWLEPRSRRPPPTTPEPPAFADRATVEALVRRIDALLLAGRPVVRSGCLTRGLTLYYFLRRAGADVSLRFGMGKMGEDFAGHCWLVFAGEPLAEPRDPRPLFIETYRISREGGAAAPSMPSPTAAHAR